VKEKGKGNIQDHLGRRYGHWWSLVGLKRKAFTMLEGREIF
jgi:hypothetical protein